MANPFIIPVRIDAKGVTKGLKNISSKFKTFGRNLTLAVSLPLAGIAVAAAKMAFGFGESLLKIQTLVGKTKEEIASMRGEIIKLGGETARSPRELADAMFAITSAGLEGKEAMEALSFAAKSSASGLGETKSIALALTGIMQSYAASGMTAERATDILTATVRAGNLEASELAPVLGRVTGLAAQLGISFEEVGASIATFTRLGVNSAEAVTGLQGIMNGLIKPTDQTKDALKALFTEAKDGDEAVNMLRASIAEDGLAATLVDLVGQIGDDQDALGDLVPNVRALSAVLGTAGAQGENYIKVAKQIADSTGLANKVFEETAQDSTFKFKQALNQLTIVGTDIGSMLLPPLVKAATFVGDLVKKFMSLDGVTKTIVIGLGILVAAIGPLLTALGFIISPIGLIITAISVLSYIVYKNFDAIIGFTASVINSFIDFYNSSLQVRIGIQGLKFVAKSVFGFIKMQAKNVVTVFTSIGKIIKLVFERRFSEVGDIVKEAFNAVKEDGKEFGEELSENFNEGVQNVLAGQLEHVTKEGIKEGLTNALNGAKGFIKGVGKDISNLVGVGATGGVTTETDTEPVGDSNEKLEEDLGKKGKIIDKANEKFKMSKDTMEKLVSDLSATMGEGIAGAIAGMAEAVGSGANLMLSFLGMLGDFMVKIGTMLISFGVAQLAFLESLKQMNPWLVIAAGAALVVAGTLVKMTMKKQSKKGGGVTPFAEGGIVTGPTLGLVGEAGAEAIIPLDRLGSIMGNQKGEFVLRGTDLILAMDRAKNFQSRITG